MKQIYKIPDNLDKSFGDIEIAIKTDDGVGIKPIPIKVIIAYFVSIILGFWLLSNTFISAGGFFLKFCFVILWILFTVLLVRVDKTKQMGYQLVLAIGEYLPKSARNVITRSSSSAASFSSIAQIDSIDDDTGLIKFTDNTYGYVYSVVGSASILLFDEDRTAIINRVDNFFKKMKNDYELIFITKKEPQKILTQAGYLKQRYDNLKNEELKALAEMEFKALRNNIGNSIHQYLILKADSLEGLEIGRNMLLSECENSKMFIKHCSAVFDDDLYGVFKSIFSAEGVNTNYVNSPVSTISK